MRCYLELKRTRDNRTVLYIDVYADDSSKTDYIKFTLYTFEKPQFLGNYNTFNQFHRQVLNYLIENNIIEMTDVPINFSKYSYYKVRLTQSKMLELI